MATEPVRCLTYAEAVTLHITLMRHLGERQFGAFDRSLVESALARPRHAAALEGADLIRQAEGNEQLLLRGLGFVFRN